MRRNLWATAIATMIALGMMAGPALANHAPADIGIVRDAAAVVAKGKYVNGDGTPAGGECSGNPVGGGIGLPVITPTDGKEAYYRFRAGPAFPGHLPATAVGEARSLTHGLGSIVACGWLKPEPITGLGASCGVSSSNNGHGFASFGSVTAQLTKLGWRTSGASFIVVTGRARTVDSNPANPPVRNGSIIAIVSAKGAVPDCLSKGGGKTGPTTFAVDIAYALVDGVKNAVLEHEKGKPSGKCPKYYDPKTGAPAAGC